MPKPAIVLAAIVVASAPAMAFAQVTPPAPSTALTLPQAVQLSLVSYPALRASAEQAAAAAAGINLAQKGYLPRVDVLAQFNRATRNNAFGMLLPQSVIPSMSGPVLGINDGASAWGSAVGVLISWEPFDFGLRGANVASAESTERRSTAALARSRFEVSAAAADAFLTLLAAQETQRAAQAAVERAGILREAADALVKAELRPGVDSERVRAEAALSEGQLIDARRAVALARVALAELLGVSSASLSVQPGPLLGPLPGDPGGSPSLRDHPSAREQEAARAEVQAREHAIARAAFPRVNLQAATYARGTGAQTDGTTATGSTGLAPDIPNWGVGLTVTFPLLDLPALRVRRDIETHRERAEAARYDQVMRDLSAAMEKARASLDAARGVVATTQVRLGAARAAGQQALARYNAGLAPLIEVADTERLLTQAEIDDALARLSAWRARLALDIASGDLTGFLELAGR
jgi:outer membrane protein